MLGNSNDVPYVVFSNNTFNGVTTMSRYGKRPDGVVLYDGPSRINGERIVLIATFKTSNEKTGNLIQTWILLADKHPIEAINSGEDTAICGSCPLRGVIQKLADARNLSKAQRKQDPNDTVNRERGCYVAVQNAPRAIWMAWDKGNYPAYDKAEHGRWFRGRGLRMGSYGDPVAVPLTTWKPILRLAGKSQPGYTHQWKLRKFQAWRNYVMASTHSEAEVALANSKGWRSYRTRKADEPLVDGETACPASEEGNYKHTCESCGACDGSRKVITLGVDKRPNMAIVVHGGDSKITGAVAVIERS